MVSFRGMKRGKQGRREGEGAVNALNKEGPSELLSHLRRGEDDGG